MDGLREISLACGRMGARVCVSVSVCLCMCVERRVCACGGVLPPSPRPNIVGAAASDIGLCRLHTHTHCGRTDVAAGAFMAMVGVVQRHLGLALLEQGRRCLFGAATAAGTTATATDEDAPRDYSRATALFREALALEGAWHIDDLQRQRQRPNACSPEPSTAAGQRQRQRQQQRQRPPEEAVYSVVSFPGTVVDRCSRVWFKHFLRCAPAARTSSHCI